MPIPALYLSLILMDNGGMTLNLKQTLCNLLDNVTKNETLSYNTVWRRKYNYFVVEALTFTLPKSLVKTEECEISVFHAHKEIIHGRMSYLKQQ